MGAELGTAGSHFLAKSTHFLQGIAQELELVSPLDRIAYIKRCLGSLLAQSL